MRTNAKNSAQTSKKLTSKISDEYTTVAIDQTRKAVGCELYRAWFPQGERVPLPYWKTYEGVKLFGAVTDDRETFFTEVTDNFTSDVSLQFLRALQTEFGEKLHVILDNAAYFTANKVTDFIEDSELKVTYLPPGSPDMNPVEECWRQFKRRLGNRYFESMEDLRTQIWPVLRSINVPQITDYLCPSV